MKNYVALTKISFKGAITYKFDFLVSLLMVPISLIIYYFLWSSIFGYSGKDVINGYTLTSLISYYVLNMIVAMVTWSNVDQWIGEDVRSGDVITYVLLPVNFFSFHYFLELGFNIVNISVELIPVFLIGLVFFGLEVSSIWHVLLFLVAIILASFMYFTISFITGLSSFWVAKISGIRRIRRIVVNFLAGSMLPLTFFPLIIQKISYFLPFQYLRYVPINIFLGKYSLLESFGLILIQLIWIFILFYLARIVWNKAFKKFAGAGT